MSADEIVRTVCCEHQVEPKWLRREMPHANRYARPRGEAARKLKDELGWSDSRIGKYFGGFHPSTILSCRRPTYKPKNDGPRPLTREELLRQIWDLRRRVEWLEQRAGFPPIKIGEIRDQYRPDPAPRCGCGLMTEKCAKARSHKCPQSNQQPQGRARSDSPHRSRHASHLDAP